MTIYKRLRRRFPPWLAEVATVMIYAFMSALIAYCFFEPQSTFSYLSL